MGLAFDHLNQIIEITEPQATVDMQDLINAIRSEEASERGITHPSIANATGKDFLGQGVSTALTVKLLDSWRIHFWAPPEGFRYTAGIGGGNLVTDNAQGQLEATEGVFVILTLAASATVVEITIDGDGSAGGGLTQEEHDRLMYTALESTAQQIKTRVLQTSLESSVQDCIAKLSGLQTALDMISAGVVELQDEAFGRWVIDFAADTLSMYRRDGTLLKTFALSKTTSTVPTYVGRTPT